MNAKNSCMVIFLFGILYSRGDAIKCYNCTYSSMGSPDLTCMGPKVSDSHLITCNATETECVKSKATVSIMSISATVIQRGCSHVSLPDGKCADVGGATVCTCSTDGCNSASGFKTSVVLTLTMYFLGKIVTAL